MLENIAQIQTIGYEEILQVVINVLLNNNHKRRNREFSSPLFSYTANMLIAAGLSI